MTNIGVDLLRKNPSIMSSLRMSTCPPLAIDRLVGLAGASRSLIKAMEKDNRIPSKIPCHKINQNLKKIVGIIANMLDRDIFVWLDRENPPSRTELYRAATIVADRLCGSIANPIIRNAQETRQLAVISRWLTDRGYEICRTSADMKYDAMQPGAYSYRLNLPVKQSETPKTINISVDVVIMPKKARATELPLLIEAKSAGDFANVNKRRKEEALKINQLRRTYGSNIRYVLFLCGYFDSGYLGYGAAEGIDWIWEHRIDDLDKLGL